MSRKPAGKWCYSGNLREAWAELDVSEDAVEAMAERSAESARWSVACVLDEVTSPIERKLLLALISWQGNQEVLLPATRIVRNPKSEVPGGVRFGVDPFASDDSSITIDCQVPVGKYAADFVVSWTGEGPGGTATATVHVEADGHDFHEKTKKQAEHDKKRDRFFVAQGLTLLRFTGSEIHRSPEACVAEIASVLWGRFKVAFDAQEAIGLAAWKAKGGQ